jgi:hypothetical protein
LATADGNSIICFVLHTPIKPITVRAECIPFDNVIFVWLRIIIDGKADDRSGPRHDRYNNTSEEK